MDLLQVQEELNIIISIMEQQLDVVTKVQDSLSPTETLASPQSPTRPKHLQLPGVPQAPTLPSDRATYRQLSFSRLTDPSAQLLENLQREYADLVDLRENSNALINRTIQLVNIRLEDHGKAILVFTIVTIIFLPLSFVTSFFGQNFSDIREMQRTQSLFWIVASSLTVATVGFSIFLAFYGGAIMEGFVSWRENRSRRLRSKQAARAPAAMRPPGAPNTFEVLDMSKLR